MNPEKWPVHITHCCVHHGCKYGNEDCPVVLKKVSQQYACETCSMVKENINHFKESKQGKEMLNRLESHGSSIHDDWQDEEYNWKKSKQLYDDFLEAVYGSYWKG